MDIEIPRDIREFNPKFIGSFTMRQSVCFIAAFFSSIFLMKIEELIFGFRISYLPTVIPVLIGFVFGWGDSWLGMPIENYLRIVFFSIYLAPKHRAYRVHNTAFGEWKDGGLKKTGADKGKKNSADLPPELIAYN